MTRLVALDVPGGERFVELLQTIWANGDAVFPIDQRLPAAERARVLAALGPATVMDASGTEQRYTHPDGHSLADLEGDDALVIPTSGTTGEPKGVIHTHAGIAASAEATSAALDADPQRDKWVACLPLAHIGGLSVVLRSLITDTPCEVHPGFDAKAVTDSLERGATLVSLVTRTLHQVPVDAFRRVLIGGAAPPPERAPNVIATYGMTETGSGIVYERSPLDGVELRIDDSDQLWVRGPMLLRAYRRIDDPAGADPKSADGWFPTGDLGSLDTSDESKAPVLSIFGRAGDMIVTGAENVWPARVEPLLNQIDGVAEAMIVGRPHPEWGHEVVARIVASDPANPPTLDAIRTQIKAELPTWYAPRALELVDSLPKTSLGKIRRLT